MSNAKLLKKAAAFKPKVDLSKVEEVAEQYRDLVSRRGELEEQLKAASRDVETMESVTLPDLFDTVGIDHIGVPAKGNRPAFDVNIKPYYKANIAASWDDDRKRQAFAALGQFKADDMIRRTVTAYIPAGLPNAQYIEDRLIGMLDKIGLEYELGKTVPWGTLTAWVKDRVVNSKPLPPLDVIGATVGKKAAIKERKS